MQINAQTLSEMYSSAYFSFKLIWATIQKVGIIWDCLVGYTGSIQPASTAHGIIAAALLQRCGTLTLPGR